MSSSAPAPFVAPASGRSVSASQPSPSHHSHPTTGAIVAGAGTVAGTSSSSTSLQQLVSSAAARAPDTRSRRRRRDEQPPNTAPPLAATTTTAPAATTPANTINVPLISVSSSNGNTTTTSTSSPAPAVRSASSSVSVAGSDGGAGIFPGLIRIHRTISQRDGPQTVVYTQSARNSLPCQHQPPCHTNTNTNMNTNTNTNAHTASTSASTSTSTSTSTTSSSNDAPGSAAPAPKRRKVDKKEKEKSDANIVTDNHGRTPSPAPNTSLTTVPTPPPQMMQNLFKEDDLHCIVCFDFPTAEIYQCSHGHLLCHTCHQKVLDSQKPVCPNCRVHLNRVRPSRNRFAEQVLSSFHVPCTHTGCGTYHRFADIQNHQNSQCGHRIINCRFNPIGCDWKGIALQENKHQKTCEMRSKSVKSLLSHVEQRNIERTARENTLRASLSSQTAICTALSKRCRDIQVRDVVIERDHLSQEMCSKTFTAVGLAFEMFLSPIQASAPLSSSSSSSSAVAANTVAASTSSSSSSTSTSTINNSSISIFFRVVSPIENRKMMEFLILPGPGLEDLEISPSTHHCHFTRRIDQSPLFHIPMTQSTSDNIHAREEVNFRVIFLDVSPGRLSPSFTTLNMPPRIPRDEENQDEESGSSDDDDDGEEEDESEDGEEGEDEDGDEDGEEEIDDSEGYDLELLESESDSGDSGFDEEGHHHHHHRHVYHY